MHKLLLTLTFLVTSTAAFCDDSKSLEIKHSNTNVPAPLPYGDFFAKNINPINVHGLLKSSILTLLQIVDVQT